MVRFRIILISLLCLACKSDPKELGIKEDIKPITPYVLVLGTAQDAGYPQINCQKDCCKRLEQEPQLARHVSSIAIVDPIANQSWVFDASPDFPAQLRLLSKHLREKTMPDGVFLTHGHMGHYTGLMYLGREAMGANQIPIYTMPRMKDYLTQNGPWSQLVNLENLSLKALKKDSTIILNETVSVIPFLVPHRDEYTETVGFKILINEKKVLFIPDIDKWQKWDKDITEQIRQVDIALLDATFYKDGEINRDMSQVPHPFVTESMELFSILSKEDKAKVYFIHFNHTNPLLIEGSKAQEEVMKNGFQIADQGMVIEL